MPIGAATALTRPRAIGEHVVIVIAPFAGGTRSRGAFEDQVVLVHAPLSFRWHFRHVELGVLQNCEPELAANGIHVGFLIDQLANLLPMRT